MVIAGMAAYCGIGGRRWTYRFLLGRPINWLLYRDTPADINRSYHILGGNRLWMDKFDPSGLEDLKLWLDARFGLYLDANGSNLASAEDDKVAVWKDFSGNGYDAASIEGSPELKPNGLNGKPALKFLGDIMQIQGSAQDFDNWSELTTLMVFSHDDANFANLIGKTNYAGWMNSSRNTAWAIITHRLDGGYNIWGPTVITETPTTYYGSNTGTKELQTQDGGGPGMLLFSYKSGLLTLHINGTRRIFHSGLSGKIQPKPDLNVTIGGFQNLGGNNKMLLSEVLILDRVLDEDERLKLEGYIAHKWDLADELPGTHNYKAGPPVTPPPDFQLFDGMVDDLRIYDRALSAVEIGQIHAGDLSEEQNIGGQSPQVYLYWGDEDGGTNPDINSSSDSAWDTKIDLGTKEIGEFSFSLSGLEFGKSYYYRFLAENNAGEVWSPEASSFSSGSFALAADTWPDTDLLLWLDAADVNGDGNFGNEPFAGSVDIWRDKSGGTVMQPMEKALN